MDGEVESDEVVSTVTSHGMLFCIEYKTSVPEYSTGPPPVTAVLDMTNLISLKNALE